MDSSRRHLCLVTDAESRGKGERRYRRNFRSEAPFCHRFCVERSAVTAHVRYDRSIR
jgi:hypothetical protein